MTTSNIETKYIKEYDLNLSDLSSNNTKIFELLIESHGPKEDYVNIAILDDDNPLLKTRFNPDNRIHEILKYDDDIFKKDSKIMFYNIKTNKKGVTTFEEPDIRYTNFLKNMILYDKCIEFIKHNTDQLRPLELEILLANKQNKKKFITETFEDTDTPLVLILFDMLYKYSPNYLSPDHIILQDLLKKYKKYESESLIVKNIDDIKNFIKDGTLNFYNLLDIQLIVDKAGYLAYKEYKFLFKLNDFFEIQSKENKYRGNGTAREALNNLLGMKAFVENNRIPVKNDFTNIIFPISLFSICITLNNNKLETETIHCDYYENYSIRVIEAGLNILGFICCKVENKNVKRFEKYNPNFIGYLINLKGNHWIALRNIPLKSTEWGENHYKLMDPLNNEPVYQEIVTPNPKGFSNPEYNMFSQSERSEDDYNEATLPFGINRHDDTQGYNILNPDNESSTHSNTPSNTPSIPRRESHYLEPSITLESFLNNNKTIKTILAISYLGKFINPTRTLSVDEYLSN